MFKNKRILFSVVLAAAGCQVSTSGLLKKATSPGSSSSSSSESSSASNDSSSSDASSASNESSSSSSSTSGSSAESPPESESFDIPYVKPAPGAPTIGAYKAPWCTKAEPNSNWSVGALSRMVGSYPLDAAYKAAPILCLYPNDSRFQKVVGAYMQTFANETGASADQIAAYLALYRHEGDYKDLAAETCKKFVVDSEASEREKVLATSASAVVGCDRYGQVGKPMFIDSSASLDNGALWHIDREAALPSQLVGTYYVLNCVAQGTPDDNWALVRYGGCRADVKQLDEKKLLAELKAGGFNEQAKANAVLAMAKAKYRAGQFEKALLARAEKDPELKALFIEAPEEAWKNWVTARKINKEAIDDARAYEDLYLGPRKSAAKGCLEQAHKNLDAYTRSHSGKTRDQLIDGVTDAMGVILFEHARSCNEVEGRENVEYAMRMFIEAAKPARGPRYAARVAQVEVLAGILSDRPKFAITADMLSLSNLQSPIAMNYQGARTRTGEKSSVVAKVEKKGRNVYVTFKTDKWIEDELDCKDTNKVIMIRLDGSLIYERKCWKTGKKIERSETSQPFWVEAELARGIAPGTVVEYSTGSERDDDNVFRGLPIVVWKNAEKKDLVAVLGVLAD